jgi:hypothetical protein
VRKFNVPEDFSGALSAEEMGWGGGTMLSYANSFATDLAKGMSTHGIEPWTPSLRILSSKTLLQSNVLHVRAKLFLISRPFAL